MISVAVLISYHSFSYSCKQGVDVPNLGIHRCRGNGPGIVLFRAGRRGDPTRVVRADFCQQGTVDRKKNAAPISGLHECWMNRFLERASKCLGSGFRHDFDWPFGNCEVLKSVGKLKKVFKS